MLSMILIKRCCNGIKLKISNKFTSNDANYMFIKSMYYCNTRMLRNNDINNSDLDEKMKTKFKYNMDKEIYTIPNMITMSRIISSPFLTYAIINDMKYSALIGCCLFGLTDWLDGYIAKKFNQMTVLGAFLDPVADKVFVAALSIGLCYKGLIPLGLASIIIGRDVILIIGSFIIRIRERPPGSPFFDTTYSATFEIAPSVLSKINTAFQFTLVAFTIGNFGLGIPSLAYIEPLWWITAVTTIGSGIGYIDGHGIRRLSKPNIGRLGKKLDEYDTKQQ